MRMIVDEHAIRECPLRAITYKDSLGGQSRTLPTDYWLADLLPENAILVNATTGAELGFSDGQLVKMVSRSNPDGTWRLPNGDVRPIAGKIQLLQPRIRQRVP